MRQHPRLGSVLKQLLTRVASPGMDAPLTGCRCGSPVDPLRQWRASSFSTKCFQAEIPIRMALMEAPPVACAA
jgi:hypothetical protein